MVNKIPKSDYRHYEQRQLAPVADGILGFFGTSYKTIAGAQLDLFAAQALLTFDMNGFE